MSIYVLDLDQAQAQGRLQNRIKTLNRTIKNKVTISTKLTQILCQDKTDHKLLYNFSQLPFCTIYFTTNSCGIMIYAGSESTLPAYYVQFSSSLLAN